MRSFLNSEAPDLAALAAVVLFVGALLMVLP